MSSTPTEPVAEPSATLHALVDNLDAMAAGCSDTPLGKLSFWGQCYAAGARYLRTLAEIAATESRVA